MITYKKKLLKIWVIMLGCFINLKILVPCVCACVVNWKEIEFYLPNQLKPTIYYSCWLKVSTIFLVIYDLKCVINNFSQNASYSMR